MATDGSEATDSIEAVYLKACVAAMHARHDGDEDKADVFAAVAYAVEAAWPEAVQRVKQR